MLRAVSALVSGFPNSIFVCDHERFSVSALWSEVVKARVLVDPLVDGLFYLFLLLGLMICGLAPIKQVLSAIVGRCRHRLGGWFILLKRFLFVTLFLLWPRDFRSRGGFSWVVIHILKGYLADKQTIIRKWVEKFRALIMALFLK